MNVLLVVLLGSLLWIAQLTPAGSPHAAASTPNGPETSSTSPSSDLEQEEQQLSLDGMAGPAAASGATVAFFPNPARDSITFVARDVCWCKVAGLRVRLYDQSGRVVLAEASDTPQLGINGVSALPNGVYLGVFELLIEGRWTRAGTEPIAILR